MMSTTPMMCVKCGGCPAHQSLVLCLFCEDGVACPCGGWKRVQQAAQKQQPARRKQVSSADARKRLKIGKDTEKAAPMGRELAGGGAAGLKPIQLPSIPRSRHSRSRHSRSRGRCALTGSFSSAACASTGSGRRKPRSNCVPNSSTLPGSSFASSMAAAMAARDSNCLHEMVMEMKWILGGALGFGLLVYAIRHWRIRIHISRRPR